jgi:DNA-binding IclR family transcriptional regulator
MAGLRNARPTAPDAAGRKPAGEEDEDGSKRRGVAAVERALSILGAFQENESRLSLSRLAERTGLYKSTTLRLIDSLESFGYIRRLSSGDYQLGPTLFRLGMLYRQSLNLEDFVVPTLRDLAKDTTESATFYVRQGAARVCLFRVDSAQVVRDHVRTGDELPLRRGAAGHVLTTFEGGTVVAKSAGQGKFTIATMGERQADLAAVAAPVFGAAGDLVGALSVSGPKSRFTKSIVTAIGASVLRHAKLLTAALGGDVSVFPARPQL